MELRSIVHGKLDDPKAVETKEETSPGHQPRDCDAKQS